MSKADLWVMKRTCRLCLMNDAKVCIFNEKTVLDNIISLCKLEVLKNDGLPSLICNDCIHKVEDIAEFITQCQRNEKILRGNLEIHNGNTNFDDKCNLEIPDEVHFEDDDEKNLMDSIQMSEDGEEFLYFKGIKIIVNRSKSKKTKTISKKIVDTLKQHSNLCPICGKTITTTRHMQSHSEKKYTCNICSKAFLKKDKLQNHITTHSEVRNFSCPECSKKFKTKDALNKHIFGVHREPTTLHPCKSCNKHFKTNSALKKHSQIHTGERHYGCSICNRNFHHKSSLTVHMRVHTGEKPYACKYCDKHFASDKTRIEHERLHTGEKPYKCPACDKGFMQLSNMKSHFRNNHKGVEFKRKRLVRPFK